jgi:CheY-like chemotaxis protein
MDISLRGEEDGLSLTRRIRADAAIAKIPVIAVTAHAFTEDKRRSYEAGCDDYLAKPFRTQQLRERIQRQLNRIASIA